MGFSSFRSCLTASYLQPTPTRGRLSCEASHLRRLTMAAPISKQERIRLNQQRSRARKSEYLHDLEKRVLECHTTCREADLQRDSYQELRKENLKLRALLAKVGIGDAQVDSYVHNDAAEPSAEQTSLRHLRPKLQSELLPAQPAPLASLDDIQGQISNVGNPPPSTTLSNTSSCCTSACPSAHPELDAPPVISSSTLGGSRPPQYCNIFQVFFESNTRPTAETSIVCAQARQLIDQYNLSGQDMQTISYRLAAGIVPELSPGEGCRVNKRLLFKVLNDISANLS
jgi:hypothetical protein